MQGEEIKAIITSPDNDKVHLIGYNSINEQMRIEMIT
jgi:hypothetical protein